MSSVPPELANPPQGVRTAISLALFAHLFAIVVATAAYTNPSLLLSRLATVLGPYLQTLNFDVGHNYRNAARYYLSQGQPADVDYVLDVTVAGRDEGQTALTLPERSAWPGQHRRQQVLANVIGASGERDDVQTELLRAVVGSLLKELGAQRGAVRCRGRNLPDLPEPGAPVQPPAAEYATAVEADVLVTGEAIDIIKKKQSAGEVAPVRRSR